MKKNMRKFLKNVEILNGIECQGERGLQTERRK